MKKSILFLLSIFVFQLSAQETSTQNSSETDIEQNENEITENTTSNPRVKRFSIGIKVGAPNILGVSIEVVTPLLKNRIAPYIDYGQVNNFKSFISGFEIDPNDKISFKYLEFGSNFYFRKYGKGLYAGIGFGNLSLGITRDNLSLSGNGYTGIGKASGNIKMNATNLKIGIKTGGRIYFRGELGSSFWKVPETIEIKGTFTYTDPSGNTQTESGTATEKVSEISGIGNVVPLLNIGFGISF